MTMQVAGRTAYRRTNHKEEFRLKLAAKSGRDGRLVVFREPGLVSDAGHNRAGPCRPRSTTGTDAPALERSRRFVGMRRYR